MVQGQRNVIKATPMQPLSRVLEEVCAKQKRPLNPAEHALVLNGEIQQLGTPVRFLNLPPNAKLELRRVAAEAPAVTRPAAPVAQTQNQSTAAHAVQSEVAPAKAAVAALEPALPPAAAAAAAAAARMGGDSRNPSRPSSGRPDRVERMRATPAPAPTTAPSPSPDATPMDDDTAPQVPDESEAKPTEPEIQAPTPDALAAQKAVADLVGHKIRVVARDSLMTEAAPPPKDLPDDYFDVTMDDMKMLMATAKSNAAEPVLMTQKLRDAEQRRRAEAVKRATIRIQLPGGEDAPTIEAAFTSTDRVSKLHALVAKCVAPGLSFHLFIAPPKQVLRAEDAEKTFYAAGLAPAALVHLALGPAKQKGTPPVVPPSGVLCPEVAALLGVSLPPVKVQGEGSGVSGGDAQAKSAEGASGVVASWAGSSGGGASGSDGPPGSTELRKKLASGGKPKWLRL